jgi:hypothetical protein
MAAMIRIFRTLNRIRSHSMGKRIGACLSNEASVIEIKNTCLTGTGWPLAISAGNIGACPIHRADDAALLVQATR